MFLFCINYYICVYINITRDCIVLQQYDVMIYCQEYGIVTGCKQIVEVVRLSNQGSNNKNKLKFLVIARDL